MTVYRFEVTVNDLEVEDPPRVPLWDSIDITAMSGSFHEWLQYQLTHDQRVAVRFSLTEEDA